MAGISIQNSYAAHSVPGTTFGCEAYRELVAYATDNCGKSENMPHNTAAHTVLITSVIHPREREMKHSTL